jgi:hypothetical protein
MKTKRSRYIATLLSIIPLIAVGFLTNTLVGLLVLALLVLWVSPSFGVTPSFSAVIDAFSAADVNTLLTISGFFAAYFLALVTWRRQKIIELRLAAGTEIRDFFQEASDNALTLFGYVETLLDACEAARAGRIKDEKWHLVLLKTKADAAALAKDKVSLMGIGVHSFVGKVGMLVNSSFFAQHALPRAVDALGELSVRAQLVLPDMTRPEDDVIEILRRMNVEAFESYRALFNAKNSEMVTNANAVFGVFQAPIMVQNLALLWSQVRMVFKIKSLRADELE